MQLFLPSFQEHSKEELTKVAENFMNDLGYGEQPFIAVFS